MPPRASSSATIASSSALEPASTGVRAACARNSPSAAPPSTRSGQEPRQTNQSPAAAPPSAICDKEPLLPSTPAGPFEGSRSSIRLTTHRPRARTRTPRGPSRAVPRNAEALANSTCSAREASSWSSIGPNPRHSTAPRIGSSTSQAALGTRAGRRTTSKHSMGRQAARASAAAEYCGQGSPSSHESGAGNASSTAGSSALSATSASHRPSGSSLRWACSRGFIAMRARGSRRRSSADRRAPAFRAARPSRCSAPAAPALP